MERSFFKKLKYQKEDIPARRFSNMHFEVQMHGEQAVTDLSSINGISLIPISRYMEQDVDADSVFDLSLAARQKNCGLGDNFVREVRERANSGFYLKVEREYENKGDILIKFDLDSENPVLYDQNFIEVEDGADVNVVIYYESPNGLDCFRNGLLRIKLGHGAKLNLVKVQNFGDEARNFETSRIDTLHKSVLNLYPVEFGGQISATSTSTYMPEEWGDIEIQHLYFLDHDMRYDLEQNLIINGRNSLGVIAATGCLMDESFKVFRGNVFLNKGCKRSIGRFANSDIILNKGVRAISIPTILCDEDDVIGEHASSYEAINEDKLYYLMSRGLTELQAKKLIVESSFMPVFKMIENDSIKEKLIKKLSEKI